MGKEHPLPTQCPGQRLAQYKTGVWGQARSEQRAPRKWIREAFLGKVLAGWGFWGLCKDFQIVNREPWAWLLKDCPELGCSRNEYFWFEIPLFTIYWDPGSN